MLFIWSYFLDRFVISLSVEHCAWKISCSFLDFSSSISSVTAVCYYAFLFHILGNVAFMDGWLFGDSLICKAAVINGSIYLITCKHFIYGICPVCPPDTKLFITVPLLGNRILSAISAALGVFINSFISFFLCNRRSQIFFLFPNFIAILLFPSLFLSSFKFKSSKSFFFPIFDTEIFFFGFILPCSIFI